MFVCESLHDLYYLYHLNFNLFYFKKDIYVFGYTDTLEFHVEIVGGWDGKSLIKIRVSVGDIALS